MRNFYDDLREEREFSQSLIWERIYHQLFPNLTEIIRENDILSQRMGIDRWVILKDGTKLTIEEKYRSKYYNDLAVEVWSNEEQQSPGWCRKPLVCDYILYLFKSHGIFYLIDFPVLHAVTCEHWGTWLSEYKQIRTLNKGRYQNYTTVSVAVPWSELTDMGVSIRKGSIEPC